MTDVALLAFGMARDALDGELWPKNGIMSVWRVKDEMWKRVDSCRRVSKLGKGVVCVLLRAPQLWPAFVGQRPGVLCVSYRKMRDKPCSTSIRMSRKAGL